MAAFASRLPPSNTYEVAILISASNGVASNGTPEDAPTLYGPNGRNLQEEQADILYCSRKQLGIWSPQSVDSPWGGLRPTGGNHEDPPNDPAPRWAHELTFGADLADAGRKIAILHHAIVSTGFVGYAGALGGTCEAWVAARLADIGVPYELRWVIVQLGRPDMTDATDAGLVKSRATTLINRFRNMSVPGASTFEAMIFAVHPSVGIGLTYRQDVIDQLDDWADDDVRNSLIPSTGPGTDGASITVDDVGDGDHWEPPGLLEIGQVAAGHGWRRVLET